MIFLYPEYIFNDQDTLTRYCHFRVKCDRLFTCRNTHVELSKLNMFGRLKNVTFCLDKLECFTHKYIKRRKKLAVNSSSTKVVINLMNLPSYAPFFIKLVKLPTDHGFFYLKDHSFCQPNPCSHHSTCVETLNGFKCICEEGYKGVQCKGKLKKDKQRYSCQ